MSQPLRPPDYADLVYAEFPEARDLRLDLYLPEGVRTAPLLIWIHGGAWMHGGKSAPPVLPLVDAGWALASMEYHFSHEARFPAQIHQCKAAVRWLRAHAERFGYAGERIGVLGASAGGHLAALLGTSNGQQALEGDLGTHLHRSSSVQAVVDFFGPTDFARMSDHPSDLDHAAADSPEGLLLGGAVADRLDLVAMANPLEWISDQTCPFLIMHGKEDRIIPWQQSGILAEALEKKGRQVEFELLERAGHGGPEFHADAQAETIQDFLRRRLLN